MFQPDLLKNKTILITGGGTGLGKSMAARFGELGANLIISSRKQEVLEQAAEELRETGAEVFEIRWKLINFSSSQKVNLTALTL